MTERLITAYDAAPFVCSYGIKQFCVANGLDYQVLLSPGYPASVLAQTGDQILLETLAKIMATEGADGWQQQT